MARKPGMAIRDVIGKLMKGVTSNKFPTRMKRKMDSRYGKYLIPSGPMMPMATSSFTKPVRASTAVWNLERMRAGLR
jgi:hypothetical protein